MLAELLTQVVGFLALFFFLKKFAWGPVLHLLDERRRQIADEFHKAARSREELAALQEEIRQRLAQIDDESRQRLQQAILEGKRISTEIQEEARNQASGIIAKSKEAVELELDKARVTLRDDVARMTVDAVEKILQRKLDAQADRQLIDAAISELERAAAR